MDEAQRITPAPVRKSITVAADAAKAFAVFTTRIGKWWPASHTIAKTALQDVVIEPRSGGRWYGCNADGSQTQWGRVLTWEPPRRVVLAWQIAGDWAYHADFETEVEVNFTPLDAGRTRVDLEHRNLERFGDKLTPMRAAFDSDDGWSAILSLYGKDAEAAA